jgi:N-methylhydantoinase A
MAAKRFGIDTGGTFTDLAVLGPRGLAVHKVSSTPDDPARAVLAGLETMRSRGEEADVVHGTTVGLNAVLTGDLARTAFVTNSGFEDLIEIGRQDRSDIYDLQASKAQIPVPRKLRFGIDCRRTAEGELQTRPSRQQLTKLRGRIASSGAKSIAIGLLHSYAFPEDEHRIAKALRGLGLPITCSCDLLPITGEYERFTAAILNAAVRPKVGDYLAQLTRPIKPGKLRLMRSSGGIMAAEEAQEFPARAMFSGPAGGVLATRSLAERAGWQTSAALDMGGTSTDVCLVRPNTSIGDSMIKGLPLAIPSVEVHTVGCGGGSIAYVDAGGALRVGPQSAGADPGPACYGTGKEATVTDAHMALGHMGANTLLAGEFPIDPDRSVRAIEHLAKRAGLSAEKAARGILEIAEIHMMRALLVITVQRAVDPASIPLVAYGGAGGLHAAGLRRLLEMPAAIVPEHPGAFSAIGLALAGESAECIVPVLRNLHSLGQRELTGMERDARKTAAAQLPNSRVKVLSTAALRYQGQGQSVPILLDPKSLTVPALTKALAKAHQSLFGFVPRDRDIEVVELRARAETPTQKLPIKRRGSKQKNGRAHCQRKAPVGKAVWPVYRREELAVGQVLRGPCIVEEGTGATIVPVQTTCKVMPFGLLIPPSKQT